MKAMAKAMLTSIFVAAGILMFTNLVMFFPWYMTLVVETFNLSQIAASDNYIKQSYYEDALDRLRDRPVFRDMEYEAAEHRLSITATTYDGKDAVGYDDETIYTEDEGLSDDGKPYNQRGKALTVVLRATYPLYIELWGHRYWRAVPVEFSLTTTGLKHYKDLDYYF